MKHIGISVIEAVLNQKETIIVRKPEDGNGAGAGGTAGGGLQPPQPK